MILLREGQPAPAHDGRAIWLLLSGVLLILVATIVIPILVTVIPGVALSDATALEKFLVGAGAVLIGISISAFDRGGRA